MYAYADKDDREFGSREAACADKYSVGDFVDFGFDIGFFGRNLMGTEGYLQLCVYMAVEAF